MNNLVIETCEQLKQGNTICYPTDTIWGLGCDATNDAAVSKLKEIKGREAHKPFVILIGKIEQLYSIIPNIPEIAYDLFEVGDDPLTIVLENAKNVSKGVIAEDGTVAIRLVKSGFAQQLCLKYRKPIVSTSANIAGEESPINLEEIDEEVLARIDYTVNLPDETGTGQPSSIIRLKADGQVEVLRS